MIAHHEHAIASYCINQFQPVDEAVVHIHAERCSVIVEFHRQRWAYCMEDMQEWHWTHAPVADYNDCFIAQGKAFLDLCDGKPAEICTLAEAVASLRFNLTALTSVSAE